MVLKLVDICGGEDGAIRPRCVHSFNSTSNLVTPCSAVVQFHRLLNVTGSSRSGKKHRFCREDWFPLFRAPPSRVLSGTFPCRKMILSRADSLSTFWTLKPENGKRTGAEAPLPTPASFPSVLGVSASSASGSRFLLS